MPVYRYHHDCGYEHSQFLKADKDSVWLTCLRCLKKVLAHQVRDKSARFAENNQVTGILRDEN